MGKKRTKVSKVIVSNLLMAPAQHGPEPERLKITGVNRWEDAVGVALRKPKPPGGWPKK